MSDTHCHLLQDATAELVAWAEQIQQEHEPFTAAQHLTERLGAHLRDGHAELGFWVPELAQRGILSGPRLFRNLYALNAH